MRATQILDFASPESLALLAARAVSRWQPLEEIAACLDVLPRAVRHELLARLTHERLRGLEICWSRSASQSSFLQHPPILPPADADEEQEEEEEKDSWSLERETEQEWRLRSASGGNNEPASAAGSRKRSFRQAFWEHRFRLLLRAHVSQEHVPSTALAGGGDDEAAADPSIHLFQDVVLHLKLHGREVVPRNVALIATLRRLQRLEVHHPEQQKTCWVSLVQLVETHPSLTELCFFHGRLSDAQLQQVRCALRTRAAAAATRSGELLRAIATLEIVSLTIRPRGHRELVALLRESPELTAVRLSACLADFENDELVANVLALPRLAALSLEHNHLEDAAFVGLRAHSSRLALRRLQLDSNAISVPTLGGICAASLDGRLGLERLELRNNGDLGDASVHALAPMLAAANAALTHLNLFNCNLGLDGATALLRALRANAALTHLDISHNFLGSRVGDLLAAFLRANTSLRSLRMNYVGLGSAGCTAELCDALASNGGLEELAVGANRLRDSGAELLFQALVARSRRAAAAPYASIDLSGNLMTHKGLGALANTVERLPVDDSGEGHQGGEASGCRRTSTANDDDDDDDESDRAAKEPGPKRRKLGPHSHSPSLPSSPALAEPQRGRGLWIRELNLLDNNFPRDSDANEAALGVLRSRVGVVRTNTWVGKRNVYDDEV
ncbi:hypothetical protein PybrP1_003446 [[Pythium] brassicae (nom. inval.)]|nr:hypothetical protein PybrP1_003446 [[Pythium] brassicae (nom. inval.)]